MQRLEKIRTGGKFHDRIFGLPLENARRLDGVAIADVNVVRVTLSVVMAFLFACVPLLPAEHMHRAGIEGRDRPLVHSHPLAAGGLQAAQPDSALVAAHGNHDLAVFLSTVYDHSPRFSSQPPLPVGARADIAPVFRPIGPAARRPHHRTHGPPRSVWLTRAPPSLC